MYIYPNLQRLKFPWYTKVRTVTFGLLPSTPAARSPGFPDHRATAFALRPTCNPHRTVRGRPANHAGL